MRSASAILLLAVIWEVRARSASKVVDKRVDELFDRALKASFFHQLENTTFGKPGHAVTNTNARPFVPLRASQALQLRTTPFHSAELGVSHGPQLLRPGMLGQHSRVTTSSSSNPVTQAESATEPILVLGTRASPLAMAQAYEVKRRLGDAFPELAVEGAIEIFNMSTQGDRRLDIALAEVGGKGLFTKELDEALAKRAVHFCVHSMKDVPTKLFEGSELVAMLPREDTRDVMIAGPDHKGVSKISEMPQGSVIGTASLRRQAQILGVNPGVTCVNFRGNVQTRLKKLNDKVVDFTLLALAGLNRMNMAEEATAVLEWDEMLPAIAQGAIGIQVMSDDEKTKKYLSKLACKDTMTAVSCEREFLSVLDGNCKTPIAGQAKVKDGKVVFKGLVCSPDGKTVFKREKSGPVEKAMDLGREAGMEIREEAGEQFFKDMQEYVQNVQAANTKPKQSS